MALLWRSALHQGKLFPPIGSAAQPLSRLLPASAGVSLWNAENVSSEGVRFKTSEAGPEPPETEKKKPYPVNAYNMFSKVVWAKLSETRGKVSLAEGAVLVKKQWMRLSEAEKAELKAKADEHNRRNGVPEKEIKPKRKPSAYNIYIKERLEGLVGDKVDGTINTRMAAAAKSWKDLPEHVKAIYAGKAAKAAGQ